MRAIWKGAVAFGLVNVPVRLYAATGEHEVPLHQVHRSDGGRIRYRRVCSIEDEPVEMAEIAKGYETDDGRLVILTDEDLASLPLATEREIEVLEFVPSDQVDPILLAKTYYLEPDKTAAKPYAPPTSRCWTPRCRCVTRSSRWRPRWWSSWRGTSTPPASRTATASRWRR
jgi:DNA end-binding protein Ku